MNGEVWAVVVGRTGRGAKSRLAGSIDAEGRPALAEAMLADVLDATRRARLSGVIAVLDPPRQRADATLVVPDPGRGLDAAVEAGLRAAIANGAPAAIVLASDLPLLEADDVRALVDGAGSGRAVLVATDRHGTGTNALVLRPADVIAPAFGPGSAERHVAAGRAARAAVQRVTHERVGLDVDTADDLAELLLRRPGRATGEVLRSIAAMTPGR